MLLLIAGGLAFSGVMPGEGMSGAHRFATLLWAILLSLAPQVSGADRAFLRLDLRLRELNAVTLIQKVGLLGGTAAALFFAPGNLWCLVAVAASALLLSAFFAYRFAARGLPRDAELKLRTFPETLESLRGFSIWSHFSGVVLGWVQTMDLYFLGMFGLPAREAGLYAACLKLANLSYALPSALSRANIFSILDGAAKRDDARGRGRDPSARAFPLGCSGRDARDSRTHLMGALALDPSPFLARPLE